MTQPMPTGNGKEIMPEIIKDLQARTAVGIKEYGVPLKTGNGRDALIDAYEEAIDLCQYLKQAIMERDSEAKK